MDIQTNVVNDVMIVTIDGRLDAVTAPNYEIKIKQLIEQGNHKFVIDFESLEYISSAGLRALLLMAKLLKEKSGFVCFANPNGNVKSVFDMSGFNALFKIESSLEQALKIAS